MWGFLGILTCLSKVVDRGVPNPLSVSNQCQMHFVRVTGTFLWLFDAPMWPTFWKQSGVTFDSVARKKTFWRQNFNFLVRGAAECIFANHLYYRNLQFTADLRLHNVEKKSAIHLRRYSNMLDIKRAIRKRKRGKEQVHILREKTGKTDQKWYWLLTLCCLISMGCVAEPSGCRKII